MAVPFSNTHLRVPRGFGTILEGLAREVMRDQPEDIPKFAAEYFKALLTQREESDVDPSEWAAKLEDRFYNNNAFTSGVRHQPIVHKPLYFQVFYLSVSPFLPKHLCCCCCCCFHPNRLALKMRLQQRSQYPSESHLMCFQQPGGSTGEGEDQHEGKNSDK
uniref:RIIa domain-containing protein n=1 Tax=Scophthalmus maximus TaxID=52904 RepID=A0A8D3AY93_SCOMX